ncbi:hypothetical protein HanXRQr2_Chr03g0135491 [Helianthus annuus]|uniref:Uncharacterized protein n=1 Tax=Helianthus annuus TaxID=4232 RepID=A0A9K3NXT6_HELAN|nr:hypothetical protein HanXRQr2_Chr03g0135491 [Helianthus annuus]
MNDTNFRHFCHMSPMGRLSHSLKFTCQVVTKYQSSHIRIQLLLVLYLTFYLI